MMSVADGTTPLLEVRGGTKRFGAVTALAGVDLRLDAGEVVALLGDNGAGKSTFIRCVTGVHAFDHGTYEIEGEAVAPRTPAEAQALGIGTVYQDLAMFDNLSAAENYYAGRELTWPRWAGPLGLIRKREMQHGAREAIDDLEVRIDDVKEAVGLMSGGQRQGIAVARAQAVSARIIILDEPTAALGLRESANVLRAVERLRDSGLAVILISHNMDEVVQVADRAVVFRQGRKVGEVAAVEDNRAEMVSLIVGGHVRTAERAQS